MNVFKKLCMNFIKNYVDPHNMIRLYNLILYPGSTAAILKKKKIYE